MVAAGRRSNDFRRRRRIVEAIFISLLSAFIIISKFGMSKIEQIRLQIMQGKRRSIFSLQLQPTPTDFLPPVKRERNATIDSESNFSLFPLITATDELRPTLATCEAEAGEGREMERIQLRPFLKEKRQPRVAGSSREAPRRRDGSVENVVSMMARSCIPTVRINRALQGRLATHTEHVLCVQTTRPLCQKPKSSKRSPSKSPAKRVRRLSRARRTVSPIRLPGSPTRKFSISAWEMPVPGEEMEWD